MIRLTSIALLLLVAMLAGCSGGSTISEHPGAPAIGEKEASVNYNIEIELPTYNYFPVTASVDEVDPYSCTISYVYYALYESDGTTWVSGQFWANEDDPGFDQYLSGSGLSTGWYVLKATAYGYKNGFVGWNHFLGIDTVYIAKL